MDTAAQYALAYALTTSAGLRGLLTLAVVSVAIHLGVLHPPAAFAWLGSNAVTLALVAVALVEILGDKVPLIDHLFHALQTIVKPAAAAILVGGIVHTQNSPELYGLMALGALNALGVHAASAAARGASTALTGGVANPVISLAEDSMSVTMIAFAFLAPLFAAILAILLSYFILRAARKIWRHRESAAAELPPGSGAG
jgi:hypothetical protein